MPAGAAALGCGAALRLLWTWAAAFYAQGVVMLAVHFLLSKDDLARRQWDQAPPSIVATPSCRMPRRSVPGPLDGVPTPLRGVGHRFSTFGPSIERGRKASGPIRYEQASPRPSRHSATISGALATP